MKSLLTSLSLGLLFVSLSSVAATLPFTMKIKGDNFDVSKSLKLGDVGEGNNKIQFNFMSKKGDKFIFDLAYKKLPSNRSYPTNLDVTIKDAQGNKLGYLFWANNGVAFLKQMGQFGMVIKIAGEPVDFRFVFDDSVTGDLRVASLGDERLVSDTLVPKYGFQMIRPMLLPTTGNGVRSQTYNLDAHPFQMNYSLLDSKGKQVEFQYNLYAKDGDKRPLLYRVYYYSDSLATLREGMFAGKYFHPEAGTFKLVYYPTMGQTAPPK